jgi:hypothetical protein
MARPTRRQISQSQRPEPTQTQQLPRSQVARRPRVESDDEAEVIDALGVDADPEDSEDGENDGREDVGVLSRCLPFSYQSLFIQVVNDKAIDLVRLALFHEGRRLPLKRDEINKKGRLLVLLHAH